MVDQMTAEYLRALKEQVTLHGEMSANGKTIILRLIAEIERLKGELEDIRVRLQGSANSLLHGESGLAAARMATAQAISDRLAAAERENVALQKWCNETSVKIEAAEAACAANRGHTKTAIKVAARLSVKLAAAERDWAELLEACEDAQCLLTEPGIMDVDEWKAWQRSTVAKLTRLLADAKENPCQSQ